MTKILLVEDDKGLREIYGVRLLAEGYDIISAGDGEEALAMAIKDRPALIISDVMMPKISGFDMLDILRSTTETRAIKVIMMTALSSEDQRTRGEQLGADRYLVKSQVGIEDVVRTVHEVLQDAPVAQSAFTPKIPTVQHSPQATAQPQPAPPTTPAPNQTPAPAPTTPNSGPIPPSRTAIPQASDRNMGSLYAAPQPGVTPFTQPAAPVSFDTTPVVQQTPITPAPAPQAASSLPQPTAPFSTPRPVSLASRTIEPIQPDGDHPEPNLSSLIEQELAQPAVASGPYMQTQVPAQAPAPEAPPLPVPPTPPSYQPVDTPQTPLNGPEQPQQQ